jgi:adenylylsulfate kinase
VSWAVWITGLPGSGKSAIARVVAQKLQSGGQCVIVLELDEIRRVITPTPTYSDAEREVVYRALVYMGAALVDSGVPVIFDATGHRRAWRELARVTIPSFAEVQLVCPLEVCRSREEARPRGAAPAGIYARSGRPGARVPGVDVQYESALSPELTIDTTIHNVETAAAAVVDLIRQRFRPVRQGSLSTKRIGDGELRQRLLLQGGSQEQKEISRRARIHAARLVRDASASI